MWAVACRPQGYILYSLRKKLKAELVGRSQEEIKELRQAGQEVTDTYQVRAERVYRAGESLHDCLLLAPMSQRCGASR